jgi:hypothetical protein
LFLRDRSGEKMASRMSNFPPKDMVRCTVAFSRRLYAQTLGEQMPLSEEFGSVEDPMVGLGAKVTTALELLMNSARTACMRTRENVKSDKDFSDLVRQLSRNGYFLGELPASAKYKELLDNAATALIGSHQFDNEIAHLPEIVAKLELASDEEIAGWDCTPDSEEWLQVDFDGLENGTADGQLNDMMEKLQQFMKDSGGIEGINLDDDQDDDNDDDDEEDDDEEDGDDQPGREDSDPKIDEDDFLEFFLKEALKLSPEEIESYRADVPDVPEEESSDDEDLLMEEELRNAGVLSGDQPDYEVLRNLLESIKSGGGVTGPAATLLGQLGVKLPKSDD